MPPNSPSPYTGGRVRLLIADDHVLIAEAIKNLLEPEFDVVGVVPDGRELIASIQNLRPHVIILDVSMPLMNGLDAGEQIKAANPRIKLIYMTMSLGADLAAEAFRRGASGYVLKTDEAATIAIAVRRAIRGETYISAGVNRDEFDYLRRQGKEYKLEKELTHRQREILQLLIESHSAKEIGYLLNLKPGTVAFHKYRMMELLGIKTTAGLIQYALKHMHGFHYSRHQDLSNTPDKRRSHPQWESKEHRRREIYESPSH
jgi:DNA-binding NarL/FixJ family response regulator